MNQLIGDIDSLPGPLVFSVPHNSFILLIFSFLLPQLLFLINITFNTTMIILILVPGVDSVEFLLPLSSCHKGKIL